MKLLFICNQNKNRSKTAEKIFSSSFETKSAGLYNKRQLNEEELNWADTVFVMEDSQRTEIAKRFPKTYLRKKILSLDIPDIYTVNQPELIDVLKTRMKELL